MKIKNHLSYLFVALLCFSCNKKISLSENGDFKKIDKILNREKQYIKGRKLAQSEVKGCFSDTVTEEKLIEEIRTLENNNVTGSRMIINGMDLSKFSSSQANFLEKKREWIYTQDLDLKDCTDIKCVFSKMYPLSNGIEGYLYYYFYLKMGYALSTVNIIPDVNLAGTSYKDVLFSQDELISFYYLSKILPTKFQRLSTLARIHRMPKNTELPSHPKACGLAGGPFNKGYIIMLDNCLVRYPNTVTGVFFPTVTHEFSHHLDNVLVNNVYGFSETTPWLNLSGWIKKENFNSVTKFTTIEWERKTSDDANDNLDGFASEYAKTNPGEDFADSVGYFRFNAEVMQKNSPKKFDWISKNIFNGRTFTKDGLNTDYKNMLRSNIINNLPQVIDSCVSDKKVYSYNGATDILNEYKDFDPELIICVFGGIEHSFSIEIEELRSVELEACDYLESNKEVLKKNVLQGVNDFVKKDLVKNAKVEKQLKILAGFISTLNENLDPRENFVTCLEGQGPEECFGKMLLVNFDHIASDFAQEIPHQIKIIKESYISENNYSAVQGKVVGLFNQIFSASELKFKEEAKRKWNSCYSNNYSDEGSDSNDSHEEVLFLPFNGGANYIKKLLLNCLNKSSYDELYEILDHVGNKLSLSISNQATKKFILNLYLNSYTSTLQRFVEIESVAEEIKVKELQESIRQKVINNLIGNTEWVGNALSEDLVNATCATKAEQDIKTEMDSSFKKAIANIKFHTLNDEFWQNQVCKSVLTYSQVKNVIANNQAQKIANALLSLNELLLKNSEADAESCKNHFTKKIMIKLRNLCLTNNIKWNAITETTLNEWMSTEQIENVPGAKASGLDYLKKNKATLQQEALKRMNQLP